MINIQEYLEKLDLSQTEAAYLLSVDPRTVRRWVKSPEEMPDNIGYLLEAWLRFENLGLVWRPDSVPFVENNIEDFKNQIALHNQHILNLDALLQKVKERGGPASPWQVDLDKGVATLGPIRVSFYHLKSGSFSPAVYTRRDRPPDMKRDWTLIEDAFACIADAFAKK